MVSKTITVNRKGMITLPVGIRNKYKLLEGSQLIILDIEGRLEIVPLYDDFGQIQQKLSSRRVIEKSYEESIQTELDLEGGE
ncbi:MAG: AbrB/MazE/SpoVT family DNA-binding domain-containing protein [Promethearchaeota archaeon]